MKAIDIKYGKQIKYNVTVNSPLNKKYVGRLVKVRVVKDDLYLQMDEQSKTLIPIQMPEFEMEQLTEEISYFGDSICIRVDAINGKNVLLTLIKFADSVQFEQHEQLNIVVNQEIDLMLREFKRENKDTIEFFTEQFFLDNENICFASPSEKLDKITLFGSKVNCVVVKTDQGIMQVVSIQKAQYRQSLEELVILFKGHIAFQNHMDNARLSFEAELKYRSSLVNTHELLKLWELYSQLELEEAAESVEELGSLKYNSYYVQADENGYLVAIFVLENKPSNDFLKSDFGYAVATSPFNRDNTYSKSIFIGNEGKINTREQRYGYELTIRLVDHSVDIPSVGYIMGSLNGSKIMAKRREEALQKIMNGDSPLTNLKIILQNGVTESNEVLVAPKKGVTEDLRKRIFGSKKVDFTERQRDAINIAINTPDIAIIQGPPGTGKTTVIRAIVARLNMISKGKVRILLSSAQHDAVDNVIQNMEYGGLPANRIGGKLIEENQKTDISIIKWISTVDDACTQFIDKEENSHHRKIIRMILMELQLMMQRSSDVEFACSQLKYIYELLVQLPVNASCLQAIEGIYGHRVQNKIETEQEMRNDEFIKLLKNQRLDIDSFLDDGVMHVSRLIRYCQSQLDFTFEVPKIWMDIRLADETEVVTLLPMFEESIVQLIEKYDENSIEVVDAELYAHNIIGVVDLIQEEIELLISKQEKTISDVILQFKDELENPSKISELINKYTRTNAATCQQAVIRKYNGINYNVENYDYVIIDEAARANPLDLLIPMSLGRKIILVGDHHQLPHMLEKDVVERLIATKNDPEVKALLDEPLFSRLYKKLEQTKHTLRKRTVMLKDQYRMHPDIASFVSNAFYDGQLKSEVTSEQRAHHLQKYNCMPIAWLDVPKSLGLESNLKGQSIYRKAEIDRVMQELHEIIKLDDSYTIGIITFYKRQAVMLQDQINNLSMQDQMRIEVGTVDSFQGKEFDIVILSTVRSNDFEDLPKRIGFLSSNSRLNVAISRAKRLLIVIGDASTVASLEKKVFIPKLHDFNLLCKKEGYYE